MSKLKDRIITLFGLQGSWKWAVRHMKKGGKVKPKGAPGSVIYKLDDQGQGRILWSFDRSPSELTKWDNANLFVSDFDSLYVPFSVEKGQPNETD